MRRLLPAIALLASCPGPDGPTETPLTGIEETARWQIEGLSAPGYVIYDEFGTPYVFAEDPYDAAALHGFAAAKDRFLQIDLTRRLGLATITELVGQDGLDTDIEAVQQGARRITDAILASMTDAQRLEFAAYARGVNAYITAVQEEELPGPSEYDVLAPLLGIENPADALEPFEVRDVAAIVTAFTFSAGLSNRELGWQRAVSQFDGLYDGEPLADLRQAGLEDDVWGRVHPVHGIVSAPDWAGSRRSALPPLPELVHVPDAMLDRAEVREARWNTRLGRDADNGWGSNGWAVGDAGTAVGNALLAGDGHLDLSSPSFVWAIGIDTQHLSGGDGYKSYGLTSPGMPFVAAGTNGWVAWVSTQPFADITDHYAEQITLDDAGAPASTLFDGAQQPLTVIEDDYVIADIPFLDSEGRTETWARYETADGRLLIDIEGRRVGSDYTPAAGETIVNIGGDLLIPEDTDGDGIITGLTFDFTGLDEHTLLGFSRVRDAQTVTEFEDALTHTAALSQNFVAADHTGATYFTQFQAMPCRGYLDRDGSGFAAGADPRFVLDGTRYPGFTIPFDEDGRLVFGDADPTRCVIAPEDYPHTVDPAQGYVLTANNDPGGLSLDNDVTNDSVYIGGPWEDDYRAERIDSILSGHVSNADADISAMQELQSDHRSNLGVQFTPVLLDAIELARGLATNGRELTAHEARLAALYSDNSTAFDEVDTRLQTWGTGGYQAESGVETSYSEVEDGDVEDAVATMIFNTWLPRFMDLSFGDERFPGSTLSTITGATGRTRVLTVMVDGRGPNNPLGLSSYNPDTEESAFWDLLGTEEIETSEEIALLALESAIGILSGPPGQEDGTGGFGTDDMDEWIWGYRHWATFPSLLVSAFGSGGQVGALAGQFTIDASVVPIADGMTPTDPRARLPGWPRHGDALNVDSGNPGWSAQRWDYDSGPAFRMVVQLDGDGAVTAQNVLPGGSSAIAGSDHWADQVPVWLANDAIDVLWDIDDVVADGVQRHTFVGGGRPFIEDAQ